MRCPKCTSIEDKVIDSRIGRDGSVTRRRRECLECGNRFTTTEVLVRDSLVVVKRDGRQEPFDRDKLLRAIRAACHKRPIDNEQITMLIEDTLDAVEALYESQVPTSAIGEHVMQRLRKMDQVAYVRFASVYKEFRDVSEFVDEITSLAPSDSSDNSKLKK
ncbi:transcriptional regulator NrdR [Oleiharenicola lentus]|uniref:transcriptional regulator NrdR n=1 Tax=Oleiharenicola lentus TaxID=2508720 RepID=UPI003F67EA7A